MTLAFGQLGVASAREKPLPFDVARALELSQASVGQRLSALTFTDSRRQTLRLNDLMDKPLVVSLVFTGCADICPMVSKTLANAVEVAKDTLGRDAFRVVTIGFDARNDTPERMRLFAASRGLMTDGWHFLSADAPTVDQLSRDLGFSFNPSPQGFDHMSQTSVIDTDGRVYRHIYGADFTAPLLVEPLKQLIYGGRIEMTSIEGLINRVRLYCTLYDPVSGTYRFDYSLFIAIILGGLSMGLMGTIVFRAWWGHRRRSTPA